MNKTEQVLEHAKNVLNFQFYGNKMVGVKTYEAPELEIQIRINEYNETVDSCIAFPCGYTQHCPTITFDSFINTDLVTYTDIDIVWEKSW